MSRYPTVTNVAFIIKVRVPHGQVLLQIDRRGYHTVRQSKFSVWTNLAWKGSQVVREGRIRRVAAKLKEFDGRTLRDIGIPHRSQIERAVRYGRES
jgi:hypothetical protein